MCIVCFFLGYFICDVIGKCGFGREHLVGHIPGGGGEPVKPGHDENPPQPQGKNCKQVYNPGGNSSRWVCD